jgi:hypothetical protein
MWIAQHEAERDRRRNIHQTLPVKHYAYRTEQCYLRWIEQ